MPLDTGIPKSGEIKFSDFYGKKLNIVVKCIGGIYSRCQITMEMVLLLVVLGVNHQEILLSWQGGKKILHQYNWNLWLVMEHQLVNGHLRLEI